MRIAAVLFVAGFVAATAAFRAAPPATVTRVRDLPPPVVIALGFPLVDAGARDEAKDVVGSGAPLPFARLISARRDGAGWRIRYETGGEGHGNAVATLRPVAGGWSVATEREPAPQPPANTP